MKEEGIVKQYAKVIPPVSTKITRKLASESSDHKNVMNYYSSISRDETGAPVRWKMSSNTCINEDSVHGRASPALAKLARSRSNSRDSSSERKKVKTETASSKLSSSGKKSVPRKSLNNIKNGESELNGKAIDLDNDLKYKNDKRKLEKKNIPGGIKAKKRGRPKSESFDNISVIISPKTKHLAESANSVCTTGKILKTKKGRRPKSLDLHSTKSVDVQLNGDDDNFKSPHPLTPCNIFVKPKKGRPKETPPTLEPEPSLSPNAQETSDTCSDESYVISQAPVKRTPGRPLGKKTLNKLKRQMNKAVVCKSGADSLLSNAVKGKVKKTVVSGHDGLSSESKVSALTTESKPTKVLGKAAMIQKRKITLPVSSVKKVQNNRLTKTRNINIKTLGKQHKISKTEKIIHKAGRPSRSKNKQKHNEDLLVESRTRNSSGIASSIDLLEDTFTNVMKGKFKGKTESVFVSDNSEKLFGMEDYDNSNEGLKSTDKTSIYQSELAKADILEEVDNSPKDALLKGVTTKSKVKSKSKVLKDAKSALNVKKKRILISHAKKHMDTDIAQLPANDLRRKLHRNLINKLSGKRSKTEQTKSEIEKEAETVNFSDTRQLGTDINRSCCPLKNLSAMVEAKRFTKFEKEQTVVANFKKGRARQSVAEIKDLSVLSDNDSTCSEVSNFSTLSNSSVMKLLGDKEIEPKSKGLRYDEKLKSKSKSCRKRKRLSEEVNIESEKCIKIEPQETMKSNYALDLEANDSDTTKKDCPTDSEDIIKQDIDKMSEYASDSNIVSEFERNEKAKEKEIKSEIVQMKVKRSSDRLKLQTEEEVLNSYIVSEIATDGDLKDEQLQSDPKEMKMEQGGLKASGVKNVKDGSKSNTDNELQTNHGVKEEIEMKELNAEKASSTSKVQSKEKAKLRKTVRTSQKNTVKVTSKKYIKMNILKHIKKTLTPKKLRMTKTINGNSSGNENINRRKPLNKSEHLEDTNNTSIGLSTVEMKNFHMDSSMQRSEDSSSQKAIDSKEVITTNSDEELLKCTGVNLTDFSYSTETKLKTCTDEVSSSNLKTQTQEADHLAENTELKSRHVQEVANCKKDFSEAEGRVQILTREPSEMALDRNQLEDHNMDSQSSKELGIIGDAEKCFLDVPAKRDGGTLPEISESDIKSSTAVPHEDIERACEDSQSSTKAVTQLSVMADIHCLESSTIDNLNNNLTNDKDNLDSGQQVCDNMEFTERKATVSNSGFVQSIGSCERKCETSEMIAKEIINSLLEAIGNDTCLKDKTEERLGTDGKFQVNKHLDEDKADGVQSQSNKGKRPDHMETLSDAVNCDEIMVNTEEEHVKQDLKLMQPSVGKHLNENDFSVEIINNRTQDLQIRKPISNAEIMRRRKRRRKREKKLVKDNGSSGFRKIELRQKISRSPLDNIALRQSIEENEYMNEQAKKAIKKGQKSKFKHSPSTYKEQDQVVDQVMEKSLNVLENDNRTHNLDGDEHVKELMKKSVKKGQKAKLKHSPLFNSESVSVFENSSGKSTNNTECETTNNSLIEDEHMLLQGKKKKLQTSKFKRNTSDSQEVETKSKHNETYESLLEAADASSPVKENFDIQAVSYRDFIRRCKPCSVVLTDFLKQLQLKSSIENTNESQDSSQTLIDNGIEKSEDVAIVKWSLENNETVTSFNHELKRTESNETFKESLEDKIENEKERQFYQDRLENNYYLNSNIDRKVYNIPFSETKTHQTLSISSVETKTKTQDQNKFVALDKKIKVKRERKPREPVKTSRKLLNPKVSRKTKPVFSSNKRANGRQQKVNKTQKTPKSVSKQSFETGEQTARKTVPPLKIKLKGGLTSKTKMYTVESAIEIKPSSVDSALENKPKRKLKSKSKSDSESEKHKSRHHHNKKRNKSPVDISLKKNGKKISESQKCDSLKANDPYEANFLEFIQQQEKAEKAENVMANWRSSFVSKVAHQLVGGKACKSGADGSLTVSACALAETKTSSVTSEKFVTMSKSSVLTPLSDKPDTLSQNPVSESAEKILSSENLVKSHDLEHFQQTEKAVGNLVSKVAVDKQYCCNHCDFLCESQNEILEHTKCLHKDELLYSCSLCHKATFKSKQEILTHFDDKHKGVSDSYICLPDFYEKQTESKTQNNVSDNIFDRMNNLLDTQSTQNDSQQSEKSSVVDHSSTSKTAEADSTTTALDEKDVHVTSVKTPSPHRETSIEQISSVVDQGSVHLTSVNSSSPHRDTSKEQVSSVVDQGSLNAHSESSNANSGDIQDKGDSNSQSGDNELNIKIVDVVSLKEQMEVVSDNPLGDNINKAFNKMITAPKITTNDSVSVRQNQLKVPFYPVSQTSMCISATRGSNTGIVSQVKKPKIGTTYKCETCHVHAPVLAALVAHLKNSHTNIPKLFQCPYCRDMEGETEALIHQHIRMCHPTDNPNPPVALSEPAKRNLKTITIPLPEKAESTTFERDIYMCLRCKKHLPSLDLIYNHLELEHREVFVYVCPFCKIFKAKEEHVVNNHVLNVHHKNIEDVSISLAIDGTEFLRVSSLIKEKTQKIGIKPFTPQQNKSQAELHQSAKTHGSNLTIPFHQNMAPISPTVRPVSSQLQQNVIPHQVPAVRAAPLQGAKKRKATLSESIAQLTMQRQRQQAQEDALKVQSNKDTHQSNLQQPPPLFRGPPPLIRYDQLTKVPASLVASPHFSQSGKSNNTLNSQQVVPAASGNIIGQLTQRLQTLNKPQSNSNQVQSVPKPIQSALFDTSDPNAFLPLNRRQQGPVLNIPQIPRPSNRPPSQQSSPAGQAETPTGALDLSRSNKSTPEPSPVPQTAQSPPVENKADDTNPEAFKIFNLRPSAPIQQAQTNVVPQFVRPNTTSTLAYRPTTPHIANVPVNAVVGNVNMVPISLANISLHQIQNLPQFVRMSFPQTLQPIVAPLSIAQVISAPQPVISTASVPQVSVSQPQQPKESQALMNLSLPMFKCPYCPNVIQLSLAEVQPHIEKSHPGSSIVFMQM